VIERLAVHDGQVGSPASELAGGRVEGTGVSVAELGMEPAEFASSGLVRRQRRDDPVVQSGGERDGEQTEVNALQLVTVKFKINACNVDAIDRRAGHAAEDTAAARL
jgi:hypothetical protein